MRQLTFALISYSLTLAAGCGSNPAVHDMGIADMSPGPDMAARMPNGVACGNMTCAVGKQCCVAFSNNMVTGATCVDNMSQCMGAALACDGPEDCTMSTALDCCTTIKFSGLGNPDAGVSFGGASAMCGSCMANLNLLQGTITTRLCHAAADCAGLTTTVVGQKLNFDKCCSGGGAMGTGGFQFCAPDPMATGGMGGYTCQ